MGYSKLFNFWEILKNISKDFLIDMGIFVQNPAWTSKYCCLSNLSVSQPNHL